jgi:hypothetical protein
VNFIANKEASLHASNEPLLQHLKVFDYELIIGIIVIDNDGSDNGPPVEHLKVLDSKN